LREVEIDHVVPVAEMAELLVSLSQEEVETYPIVMEDEDLIRTEIKIAEEDNAFESGIMTYGKLSPFTCPECHGVMNELKDGARTRYRCHTGHAFSPDSLLTSITENIEDSMWNTVRAMEESIMLLEHMARHLSDNGQTQLAMLYFQKVREAEDRVNLIRTAIFREEHLSAEKIEEQAGGNGSGRRATRNS
jgi:two-component system, chemotaxis family, protein-glutamate methylesterase/glutaminase